MKKHPRFNARGETYWVQNPYPADGWIKVKDSYGRVYLLGPGGIERTEVTEDAE